VPRGDAHVNGHRSLSATGQRDLPSAHVRERDQVEACCALTDRSPAARWVPEAAQVAKPTRSQIFLSGLEDAIRRK
jgi:hypothetical protein